MSAKKLRRDTDPATPQPRAVLSHDANPSSAITRETMAICSEIRKLRGLFATA